MKKIIYSIGIFLYPFLTLSQENSQDFNLGEDITTCDESVTLDAGDGYGSYLWSTGENTQIIEVNESGSYSVEVYNSNNNYSSYFDGVNDYYSFTNPLSLSNEITVSLWAKFPKDSSGPHSLISDWPANGASFNLRYNADTNSLQLELLINDEYETISYSLSNEDFDVWNHISFTYDGNSMNLYFNDNIISDNSVVQNGSIDNSSSGLIYVGNEQNNPAFFEGNLDDVSIWNTALSQDEIQQYTNCPPTGSEEGLVGYNNFEEGPQEGQVLDLSPNGNNGIINGVTYNEDVPEQNCSNCCDAIENFIYVGSFEENSYYVSAYSTSWNEANETCNFLGGNLATITSQEKQNFLTGLQASSVWIGLSTSNFNGNPNSGWQWVTEELFDFNNWADNEPSNDGLYVEMYGTSGFWNDQWEDRPFLLELSCQSSCSASDEINVTFEIEGCTDETACNYDSNAICDDNSCQYIEEVDLGEDISTCEESVILDAGDGYGSYEWSTGETTQTIEISESGTYSVDVSNNQANNYSMSFENDFIYSNGYNGHVSIPDNNSLDFGSEDFHISFQFKSDGDWSTTTDNEVGVITKYSQSSSQGFFIRFEADELKIIKNNFNTTTPIGSILDNEWHSVNIDFDFLNGQVNIYYDGILVDSDLLQDVSNSSDNDESLDIGINWDFSDTFNGNLDNIQIWNISLSQEEIQGYINCLPTGNEQGLVGYWNFEEGSGETVFDLSQNGNNGTINGATYSEDVPEQNCQNNSNELNNDYSFDFLGERYITVNNPFYNNNSTLFTVNTWLFVEEVNEPYGISVLGSWQGGNGVFLLSYEPSDQNICVYNSGGSPICFDLNDYDFDSWIHVSIVYDGTSIYLLKNGVIEDSVYNPTLNISNGSSILTFGVEENLNFCSSDNTGCWFNGKMDDVQLWNYNLTLEEIQQYMNCPPLGNENGLVGYWNFDNNSDEIYDLTDNLNNGIVYGGSLYSDNVPEFLCLSNICSSSDEINVTFDICGCTDETACNYNSEANEDDGSCEYIEEVDLGEDISTCDESITLDAGTGYSSYEWSTGETTQIIEVSESGNYSVEVINNSSEAIENNYSMSFDGENTVDLNNINLDNTSFSISIDFKTNTGGSYYPLIRNWSGSGNSTNGHYLRFETGGDLSFAVNNLGVPQQYPQGDNIVFLFSGGNYADDLWHNASIVYDQESSIAYMYIDGILVDEQNIGVPILTSFNSNSLVLGNDGFTGNLDNLHYWNIALNQADIQQYINCSPIGNEEGLVGYWNFEEGPQEGQVFDLSGNENNGTINGAIYSDNVPEQNCSNNFNLPQLGDFYEGGTVFYIDNTTGIGLVALENSIDCTTWGCSWNDFGSLSSGYDIGDGYQNTIDIINSPCGSNFSAALLCYNFESEYNDWFLPSLYELNAIYENIHLTGINTYEEHEWYWSSTATELACESDNAASNIHFNGNNAGFIAECNNRDSNCGGLIPVRMVSFVSEITNCVSTDEINVTFDICGCTDATACNYNSEANEDDGSCEYIEEVDLGQDITTCEESITLDAGDGYGSYEWSTGEDSQTITVAESGTYSVEVGNNSSEAVENNYSMSFDGNDYVRFDEIINFETNSFTLSISCKLNNFGINQADGYSYVMGVGNTGGLNNDKGFKIALSSNYNSFVAHAGDGNTVLELFGDEINLDQWYNVSYIFDRSINKFSLAIDSEIIAQTDIPEAFGDVDLGANITIGAASQYPINNFLQHFLEGFTDNVQIWNLALTEQQMEEYMNCPPIGNEEGLVGYWNFEEGEGDVAYDLSPNGNNGTINGVIYNEDVPEQNCSNSCDAEEIDGFTYLGFYGGSNYYGSNYTTNINSAESDCNTLGGALAVSSSTGELDFLCESEYTCCGNRYFLGNNEALEFGNDWSDEECWILTDIFNASYPGFNSQGNHNFILEIECQSWSACNSSDEINVIFDICGCTDETACNYNSEATEDDGSCEYIEEVYLGEDITTCDESVTLDAGSGYGSYEWSTGETTQTIEISESGNYSVEVGGDSTQNVENNYSMYFDGSNDYVNLLETSSVDIFENGFTISFDTKQFSENDYENILFHHSSNGTYVFQIAEDNNYVRFGIKESNGVWTFIQGILNYEWTNITGVYNSSINKIEIYIDGYLADEDYINSNSLFSDPVHPFVQVGGILQGGSGPLIQQYNGYFDNISFWSYPLSSNEVQNFINCPPTGNEEGLVGFWNFEEGSSETVFDLSPNGNNGDINGSTYSEDIPEQNCSNNSTLDIEGFTYGGTFNGSDYYISNQTYTWIESNDIANSLGGELLVINDESEQTFILNNLYDFIYFDGDNASYSWVNLSGLNSDYPLDWYNGLTIITNPCNHFDNVGTYGALEILGSSEEICIGNEYNDFISSCIIEMPSQLSCLSSDEINVIFETQGCTDETACNYDSNSICDDNSCEYIEEVNLGEDITTCDELVTLDAGSGYGSYEWSTGETTQTIEISESGNYSVDVSNIQENNFSMNFDGDLNNTQYYLIPNDPSFDLPASFTFSAYVNIPDSWEEGALTIINNEISSYPTIDFKILDNKKILARVFENPDGPYDSNSFGEENTSSNSIQSNIWTHISASYDGNILRFYIDGVLDSEIEKGYVDPYAPFNPLHIGTEWSQNSNQTVNPFLGNLDNVQIWNISLSQEEIQQYMNCPPMGDENGLVGFWNFEEGSGNTILDLSLNQNDGIVSNNSTYSDDVPNQNCSNNSVSEIEGFTYQGTFNGNNYYKSNLTSTWIDANEICNNNGGYLANISSLEENSFIQGLSELIWDPGCNCYGNQHFWIGFTDQNSEGSFYWENGEDSSFTNWFPNNPDNYNNEQHYALLEGSTGMWDDDNGYASMQYYILEMPTQSACTSSDEINVTFDTEGCTDESACNYDSNAICDDNSCEYIDEVDLGEDITTCDESVTLDAGEGYDSYQWSTEETTQTIEVNSSGSYSVEVVNNSSESVENNYSMNFNYGDGDDVYVDYSPQFNSENLTVSFSIFPNSYCWSGNNICESCPIGRYEDGYNNPSGEVFRTGFDESIFYVDILSSSQETISVSTDFPLSLQEWTTVSFTFDGNELKLYINGLLVDITYDDDFLINTSGSSGISMGELAAANGDWYRMDGLIDNIEIWNIALSEYEIENYINCSPTGSEEGLVGYWNFEEGPNEGQVLDLSTNGNNGTINGATYNENVPEQNCQISSCSSIDDINVTINICGCTDSEAINYNPEANDDDGSCIATIEGCTDETACNYNPDANFDDNSCWYLDLLINNIQTDNYNNCWIENPFIDLAVTQPLLSNIYAENITWVSGVVDGSISGNITTDAPIESTIYTISVTLDGYTCETSITINVDDTCTEGCTDETAFNFDPNAGFDDGSCITFNYGCTDELACNYDSNANTDDLSCIYCSSREFIDDSYLDVSDVSFDDAEGVTISFWVNDDDYFQNLSDFSTYIDFGSQDNYRYVVRNRSGKIEAFFEGDALPNTINGSLVNWNYPFTAVTGSLIEGNCGSTQSGWHNITAVYCATGVKLYINGQIAGQSVTNTYFDNFNLLPIDSKMIGNNFNLNESADASIDEVRIWKRALSVEEVIERMGDVNQLSLDVSNEIDLVGYWKMDCENPFINDVTGTLGQNYNSIQSDQYCDFINCNDNNYEYNCIQDDCNACNPNEGCMDQEACNYDPLAVVSLPENCFYIVDYCPTLASTDYYNCDCECINDENQNGICDEFEIILGCTYPTACNYNPDANEDDGSCEFISCITLGCTDSLADNFDPDADVNDDSCFYSQTLEFTEGWNLWSTYIDPINPDIEFVLSDIIDDVFIMKDESGASFWPMFGLNSIGPLSKGEGYQLKMYNPNDLVIEGSLVPYDYEINIPEGWSFIGYLHQDSFDAVEMMNPVSSSLIILKDGDGFVYWPLFGINGIGNMNAGEAFQIKSSSETSLNYPYSDNSRYGELYNERPIYFNEPINTGSNMIIGFPQYAWESILAIGDEIAAYDSNGKLVGSSIYEGNHIALTVWGDDLTTDKKDGLFEQEEIVFRLWNSSESIEQLLEIRWEEGSGLYSTDGISIAGQIILGNQFNSNKQLIKKTDVLGREINGDEKDIMILHIYNDGSIERIFIKE